MIPKFQLALLSIAGTAAYLGLAILGWRGFGPFFSHPARTALAVVTLLLSVAALFTSGNIGPGKREDRSNRWVIGVFAIVGLLLGYLPAYTDRRELWTIDGDMVRWLGLFLFTVGGALRIWPVFVLGRRFSGLVAIQPGHELVTGGVYAVIRHPSYLGLLVNALGWVLVFRSTAGVLLVLSLVPVLAARIRAEERLLLSEFGSAYDTYRKRTWRLIPGLY
jgi:protein-S-isoprenylcysteine O-methyltransferase Ste14